MTTLLTPPSTIDVTVPFTLEGISWDTYERLRNDLDDSGQRVYITYDTGRMTLMAPRTDHEWYKKMLARMIEAVSAELDIPIFSLGSTTWKRKDLKKGMEPDECYYIQHEPEVRGRLDLDLANDPPPDLALEVEVTNALADKLSVLSGLRIPEVWHFNGVELCVLLLQADGTYVRSNSSSAFPFLPMAEIPGFLAMLPTVGEFEAFRAWRMFISKLR